MPNSAKTTRLVIVESPAKAKTISGYLGPGYVVWDKAATIRFRKPGRSTLTARFVLEEAELHAIRKALETSDKVDRVYTVELVDAERVVHATVEKTIQIRRRAAPGSGVR